MDNNKAPKIVIADKFIKDKSAITLDGRVIRNTPENPRAVEDYFDSFNK